MIDVFLIELMCSFDFNWQGSWLFHNRGDIITQLIPFLTQNGVRHDKP